MTTVETRATATGSVAASAFSFWYGAKQALHEITLELPPRAVTAFIGPSGCGKSTFLRSINRMNDMIPDTRHAGTITLGGAPIHAQGMDVVQLRQRVGMVFQRWNPFPKSIFENVAFGPRVAGWKGNYDDLVEESLTRAALWSEVKDKLDESALALSGGQQQRLCIARAIATSPDVVLMDEPCSALDPIATLRIEELMLELKKDYSIIIVTHNMQQAARVSDRTAFFSVDVTDGGQRTGRLVEFDTTDRLFTSPSNPETERYITGRFG